MQTQPAPEARRPSPSKRRSPPGIRRAAKKVRPQGKPVHDIIRRWRERMEPGMTQFEVANAIGVSLTTVARWEAEGAGGRPPKLKDIWAMEDVKPGLVRLLFPKSFA